MSESKVTAIQQESHSWKRALTLMMDENIHLKSRLSDMLKSKLSRQFLARAELFQNSFVRQDDLIRLLRNDVAEFDKLVARELYQDNINNQVFEIKLKGIRTNINRVEKQFDVLKQEFNMYMSETLNA